ncbi:MAG: flagellar brake protein [Desulfobacterales bacterium]|nr:flagellar brake protein [Desulfobacterales bacterium]
MNPSEFNRSQRLFIELGTALQLSPDDPERAVSGELIGMQVGKYLIVQLSRDNWERSGLKSGEHLAAKYILSNDVYGFKAHIIRTIQNPDYLIFLEYPEDVKSCNIRSEKRVECFLPTRIFLDNQELSGIIVNINKSGCLAQVDGCPELDCCRTTPVTIQLPYGQFDNLSLSGEVRTSACEGDQSRFGISFDELDAFSKKVLATLVPALNF